MIASIRTIFSRVNKMVVFGILLVCLLVAFIAGSAIVKAGNSPDVNYGNKRFTNFSVKSGDTLWDIAEDNMDYAHYDSVYEYVQELKRMNNLTSDEIYAGQNLLMTYYED